MGLACYFKGNVLRWGLPIKRETKKTNLIDCRGIDYRNKIF